MISSLQPSNLPLVNVVCPIVSSLTSAEMNNEHTVSRIALVSPTRSSQIESILLRMLQAGQLRGRVSEQQLIDLLEQVRLCPLGNYISAFVNHIYRPTKHRKRLQVRVLSWYVLLSDDSVQVADPPCSSNGGWTWMMTILTSERCGHVSYAPFHYFDGSVSINEKLLLFCVSSPISSSQRSRLSRTDPSFSAAAPRTDRQCLPAT